MNEIRGERLYVNLSASQVRKRLKRFGHGVRKVQSAGRHQAVIIHTATGRHLQELLDVFGDAHLAEDGDVLGTPIESVRNVGPASANWLREIGCTTRADLERLGPVLAYRLVKRRQARASLNFLWALAAGLTDRDWRDLTSTEKAALKLEFEGESDSASPRGV